MTTDEHVLKHIGYATPQDHELFEKWCGPTIREFGPKNGLGRNGKPMPQGAGPHCIQWWRDVLAIAGNGWNPRTIDVFEIGFCIGLSARIMLRLEVGSVTSVDPSEHEECKFSAGEMLVEGELFSFHNCKSIDYSPRIGGEDIPAWRRGRFNLAFIDGDHAYDSIMTDIAVCRRLRIKTMVFDDWHPHFGPDTQRAVIDSNLRVRAIIGNYALCEDDL